ncbi:MAG: class I SAM-dependent methyltransferase [Alphaproteobacteria bacterium]
MSGFRVALKSRLNGIYARAIYLPLSSYAQDVRAFGRRLRGVSRGQATRLPVVRWQEVLPRRPVSIVEPQKRSGDVNLAELAVLASAAAAATSGDEIAEIGTFDGRTTLNFAVNAPLQLSIFTLDLPPDTAPRFDLAAGERAYVEKPRSGRHFAEPRAEFAAAAARITQAYGDSAAFDWSSHFGRAALVFVDGSHAYDYVIADSDTAFRLVADKGMVIWHDYGVWEGVTRALEEIEASRHLGLRHIRGTSLVVWQR